MPVSYAAAQKIFLYVLGKFIQRYGEGHFEEAAVWGRKLAEVYCIVLLMHFAPADRTGDRKGPKA